ncbi:MAG: GNAT family N-acetyltransferase [Rhizobiaceae bacterium]
MSITIRPLESADRQQWLELWRGYQAFYEADLSADEDSLWQRLMKPSPDGPFCLVAQDETGRLLGITQFLYHMSTWSQARKCYLNDLFTTHQARGKGVARALIEGVYARADEDGNSEVYWMTQEFNHTARKLYDRIGRLTPFIKYNR